MTQTDLQKILRSIDPGAVLVSARILERVIRDECHLPNMQWNVPHQKSFVCDRQTLFRHAEQADLELDSDQLLPDTVLLLLKPDAEELSNLERKRLLLKFWRRLFHTRIHAELRNKIKPDILNDQGLLARIEVIGRPSFEEIRNVLIQDNWLPGAASDRDVYVEFAAVYLEMRWFAQSLLANYFPGIRDFGKIETLLEKDVNASDLFNQTRLTGAADPEQAVDSRTDEPQEMYWKLVRSAQKNALQGNIVAAAILRMRASRVAPAAATLTARQEAELDITRLTARLGDALSLSDAEKSDWSRYLTLLLDKADQGRRPMEARVLEELQRVCQDHEQEIYTLDLVEYIMSVGKRPIKRPLPSQRLVRIVQHLRNAIQKMSKVRLVDQDRNHLIRLMQLALTHTEERLQRRFRPVLTTAMTDVGLEPNGPLERAAFEKMVGELLDRISTYGFLTFAELRDTISRNQLKLPDLKDPVDFVRGDPLIRLDRRLTSLLDGVYRPGEFYVLWLERVTALKFGTWWGRAVTRYFTGPFLLAWLILFIIGFLTDLFGKYVYHEPTIQMIGVLMMGPAHPPAEGVAHAPDQPSLWWHFAFLIPLGLFLIAVMQSETFRLHCKNASLAMLRTFRWIIWDVPIKFVPQSTIRWIIQSWGFQLIWWYVLKPLIICGFIGLYWHVPFRSWYGPIGLFLLVSFLLNSRAGRALSDNIRDVLSRFVTLIRAGLLPGLIRFIIQVFKQVVELVEYALFKIDEWLRFRSGEGRLSLVIRTILGVLWYPISFLARFYMVVLIEPGLNPIKFAISSVAAKIVYPMILALGLSQILIQSLSPIVGGQLAYFIVVPTLWLLPDAFGFLAWELKENWSLFRANRGLYVTSPAIGHHGETLRGLLQPGFHSGTIPRLFAKLRHAERHALQSRNWNQARIYRHELEEVAKNIQLFISRDLLLILRESRSWQRQAIECGQVTLSTNTIRIELEHLDHPSLPVEIEILHENFWILAGISSRGWLDAISREQQSVLAGCLAYFYKRSNVDIVREQLQTQMSQPIRSVQIIHDQLRIWTENANQAEQRTLTDELASIAVAETKPKPPIFRRMRLFWTRWQDAWNKDQAGELFPALSPLTDALLAPFPAVMAIPSENSRQSEEAEHQGNGSPVDHPPPLAHPENID